MMVFDGFHTPWTSKSEQIRWEVVKNETFVLFSIECLWKPILKDFDFRLEAFLGFSWHSEATWKASVAKYANEEGP